MNSQPTLFLLGTNHNSAPLELREDLYIPDEQLAIALPRTRNKYEFLELAAISTCNRFEMLGVARADVLSNQHIFDAYIDLQRSVDNLKKFSDFNLKDITYLFLDREAVLHIYRVASSLDSMIVGETQITGQFKEAIILANKAKTLGPTLGRLGQEALATAKKVRTQTRIGQKHVSISHAAIDLAKKVFGELEGHRFLVIGAGEMARVAAKHIVNYNPKTLSIANRTLKNAQNLVDDLKFGTAYDLDEVMNLLADVDIVLSSTSANNVVVDVNMALRAQSSRRGRPLVLLDIALPRDIEQACGEVDDIYLFDIDDLQQVVGANYEERRLAAQEAQTLIDESVVQFEKWLNTLSIKPALAGFRTYLEELFDQETKKTFRKGPLSNLNMQQQMSIEALLRSLINKISGDASQQVKNPPNGYYQEQLADALTALFLDKVHGRKKK